MMPDVVIAGHICLDIIPALSAAADLSPGKLIQVGPAQLSTGGAVSNVGLTLHKLGASVRLVGKVGDDPFGEIARRIVRSYGEGLDSGIVVAPGEATSYSIVLSPPGMDRTFLHAPECNDTFASDDVTDGAFEGTRIFHFGYPPLMARIAADDGAELEALFRRLKQAGAATSLDMSLPDPSASTGRANWPAILRRALPYVDFFLPSEDELAFMLPSVPAHPPALAAACLEMGAGAVVVKRGAQGLYARTGDEGRLRKAPVIADPASWANQEAAHRRFAVRSVGATGSGDAAIGGFLMGLLRGFSLGECLRAACAVSACCVEAADSLSAVQSWEETEARLNQGWALGDDD